MARRPMATHPPSAAGAVAVTSPPPRSNRGQEADEKALAQQEAYLANIFDSQSSAFYTSGHLLDDGMIDPRDTRKTLGFLLETVWETRHRSVRRNSFGIARM